ncbi:RsmE family RNA methyltransferase [Pigmentibacter sp. JX0631]|uniref:RsmE family RNA methyltransferase n=1 Tax=Pigmentibacter sp. JX0631 TaxID=2976982 RepID=UPI002469AC14|nr:RsmE family RNA methyltransferase [Pigmentibacter sp. JX0631]WGL61060.1 RsmE family RNA methyltransferase [Pigmentibacter sp. JX0631]
MSIQKQLWTFISHELNLQTKTIQLNENEHHYAFHVLRISVGDAVEVTNCKGIKAKGIVEKSSKKEIIIKIIEVIKLDISKLKVALILAYPKPTTLEEVVSSASELGVNEIHIFKADRSATKAPIKLEKLKIVSDEAVRISKSSYSAEIFSYESLNSLAENLELKNSKENLILFCDESHVYEGKITNSILTKINKNFEKNTQNIYIVIGPEASFSDNERIILTKKIQAIPVSLGANILRVPNAALSALGVVLNYINDLKTI